MPRYVRSAMCSSFGRNVLDGVTFGVAFPCFAHLFFGAAFRTRAQVGHRADHDLRAERLRDQVASGGRVPREILFAEDNQFGLGEETLHRQRAQQVQAVFVVADQMHLDAQCRQEVARRPAPEVRLVVLQDRPEEEGQAAFHQRLRV